MQSWLEGRNWVGKCAQETGMTATKAWEYGQAKPIQTLRRASQGVNWSWCHLVHQESPRSDIFRKRAIKPLLKQKQRHKHLTWAKEKNNWTDSGGRVERHSIHVAWSPVWSVHSQWWFGLTCHLLVFVHCVFYQETLEHFMLPSADKLYGDADFIFQQDLAPAHTAKGTKSWFSDHGVTVLD